MDYYTACQMFGITPTKRQHRKWNAKKGKAFLLSKAFPAGADEEKVSAFLDSRAMRRMEECWERSAKMRAALIGGAL